MIAIRTETASDRDAVHEVIEQAFGRAAEAELVDALRREPDFIADLSLVATSDSVDKHDGQEHPTVVGHLLFSPIRIGDWPGLALAPLAVLPAYQSQGIGSKLVEAGLQRAAQLGHAIVVVVGHPTYYPRFGFVPARAHGLEAPFPVSDEAFMVRELSPGALAGVSGLVRYAGPFGID